MTLTTKVSSVVTIQNIGYKRYYDSIFKQIKLQNYETDSVLHASVVRFNRKKVLKQQKEATHEFKRMRKHNWESKNREAILEERLGNNDYQSMKVLDDRDKEDLTKQHDNQNKMPSRKDPKHCKWCDKITNHKSWVSKECVAHSDYLQYRAQKQAKKQSAINRKKQTKVRT